MKRWNAQRPVITSAPSCAGSGTSTKRLRCASASINSRVLGVPTSSSGTNMKETGSGVVSPASTIFRTASRARKVPPFMSRMPGP